MGNMAGRDSGDSGEPARESHELYSKLCQILGGTRTEAKVFNDLRRMREKEKSWKTSHSKQIDYVFKLLQQYNLFPDFAKHTEEKNDRKSEKFRQKGNFLFNSESYVEAIAEYNRSICYAVTKENISIALGNRSAAFYRMKMFRECLESIRLAREFGYPDRLKDKLDEREAACKIALKNAPKQEVFVPKIGMPANEMIPFLANCLKLRENEYFGRHVVTEEDIPAGTIIALEEPFCKMLLYSEEYLRCTVCLADLPHLLLPCDTCTQAMFCSEECKEKASGGFHAIECPITSAMTKIFDDNVRLSLRMVLCAFLAFPDAETMASALETINREKKNAFSFDWRQELSPEELFTPIHTLVINEDKIREKHLFVTYYMSCLLFNILKEHCKIFRERYLTNTLAEDTFKNIIFRHLFIVPRNAYCLQSVIDLKTLDFKEYGSAVFAFKSLLNHSCSPNTVLVPMGSTIGTVTIKNIEAGGQIFGNYGPHHKILWREFRQDELQAKYNFLCQCVACVKNFPTYRELPPLGSHPQLQLTLTRELQQTKRISLKTAKKSLQKAIDYIQKYKHLYPIRQLCDAEEEIKFCYDVMGGNISLQMRQEIHQNS
ncbi:SET and MYND domain-containing protein 4-like [Lutzomyia longipalpis]|uniref:SET and MYND domain-containing protein 4-like n=1 Tax=Lutzomyia longipalpis TaxID=7200 RepID=UPI0024839B42|nr:SET and MYND domain-containing protein 4-like [Lutzomyia longipalpis]